LHAALVIIPQVVAVVEEALALAPVAAEVLVMPIPAAMVVEGHTPLVVEVVLVEMLA
jgi:hypothetical protein